MKNEIINEAWDVQRVKELTMKKVQGSANAVDKVITRPYKGKFAAVVAAVMLITLTSAITVLAVSGTVDFGSMFRSVFENEQAEPYVITEENIITSVNENDVEVRIISAFHDAFWGLLVNMEIYDPTGKLLTQLSEEDNIIFFSQRERAQTGLTNMYVKAGVNREGSTGIEFIDNYTLRVGFDHVSYELTDAGDIIVRLDIMALGVSDDSFVSSEDRPFWTNTGFILARNIGLEQPMTAPLSPFLEIMELTLDGSILSIAYRDIDAAYGWNNGMLLIERHDDQSPIWAFDGYSVNDESRSVMFFDIGTANLEDFRLDWMKMSARDIMFGDWKFVIPSVNLIGSRTFVGKIDGYNAEIIISALGARIYVDGFVNMRREGYEDYDIEWLFYGEWPADIYIENALVLYLADGTTIEPKLVSAREDPADTHDNRAFFVYDMEFVNPDNIVSVTFLGVEIGG